MRNRASIFTLIALVALSIIGATTPANAQKKDDPKIPVERKVVTDEAGLQQWAPFEGAPCPMCRTNKVIDCPTCKDAEHAESCLECGTKKEPRTKKAPCRLCAGEGKLPDMLIEGPCIACTGAGVFPCVGCGGETSYPVEGGGKKRQKCAVCRGEGSIRCSVCKGKRRCEPISPKKGIAEAAVKDLEAAAKTVEGVLVELRACEFAGIKERDELKKYQAILKDLAKISKPTKVASSMIKDLIGLASRMDQYTNKERRKSETFDMFRRYNVYWLEGQAELLKLAIERAKHNENATKK